MRDRASPTDRTARITLVVALVLMAAVFAAQGAVDTFLTREADVTARQTFSDSLRGRDLIAQISRDIDRKRILIDGHIFTQNFEAMQAKEAELASVSADLAVARRAYASLPLQPGEELLWRHALVLIDAFDRSIAEAVQLSRNELRLDAYAHMTSADRQYEALHADLDALTRISLREVTDALSTVGALQRRRETARWVIRGVGLVIVVLFGWWANRRLARYEREIARYDRELEQRNMDLDAFVGRVAHDLRNTLAPLAALGDLLRATSDDPRVLGIASKADRSSWRAVKVLEDMLDFARSGQSPAPGEHASLAPVLDSVREELAQDVARIGASLEVEPIPAISIRCSPGLLHVVVANL